MQVLNTNQELTDEMIVGVLEDVSPRIRTLAFKHNVDFDDLYQNVALILLTKKKDGISSVRDIHGYVYGIARFEAINFHSQNKNKSILDVKSLDASLADDFTLLDRLAEPPTVEQTQAPLNKLDKKLHTAIHRLPIEDQKYVRERFGMGRLNVGYTRPDSLKRSYDPRMVRNRVYRSLRGDRHLERAIAKRSK